MSRPALLTVSQLSIRFDDQDAWPWTVDAVGFTLARGDMVALVGESGSGKSLVAHTIAGILTPAARLEVQRLEFGGVDLRSPKAPAWGTVRGREIGTVFQNPRAALNPIRTVGQQVGDVIRHHIGLSGARLREQVVAALSAVRIPDPEGRLNAYSGELSGGMCQRVMLAIALAANPSLLIADEPTTGLDTTTQAAILDLIREKATGGRMATLLITHDLALARTQADRMLVMHAGQLVETADTADLFARPRHPYTSKLMGATPQAARTVQDLAGIPGTLPRLTPDIPACRFAARCERSLPRCTVDRPPLAPSDGNRSVACWNPL